MKRLFVYITVITILLIFTACSNGFSPIEADDVEKITIWTHLKQRELTKEEIDKIIEQYNQCEYGGKSTGEGGTPEFGVTIDFKNGKHINVNDFYVKSEVFGNKSFYLINNEMYGYVKEMAKQLDEQ